MEWPAVFLNSLMIKKHHPKTKAKTATLVLSSGGARGLAHIGVIEVLEERGYQINAVAGCSMGALIGGIYAKGNLREYKEWICHLDRIDVFALMDFTLSTRGFIKGNRVFNAIQSFIGDGLIEELPIPFTCNAVNIHTGQETVFTKGSLFDAIRASAAIPTVIKPYPIHGAEYVDGALLNPIPLNLAREFENQYLIASDVNAPIACQVREKPLPKDGRRLVPAVPSWVLEYKSKMARYFPQEKKITNKPKSPSFLDLMNMSFDLMQDRLSDYILQLHPADAVIQMSRKQCGTFEFYRAREIIAMGRELAQTTLKQLEA